MTALQASPVTTTNGSFASRGFQPFSDEQILRKARKTANIHPRGTSTDRSTERIPYHTVRVRVRVNTKLRSSDAVASRRCSVKSARAVEASCDGVNVEVASEISPGRTEGRAEHTSRRYDMHGALLAPRGPGLLRVVRCALACSTTHASGRRGCYPNCCLASLSRRC